MPKSNQNARSPALKCTSLSPAEPLHPATGIALHRFHIAKGGRRRGGTWLSSGHRPTRASRQKDLLRLACSGQPAVNLVGSVFSEFHFSSSTNWKLKQNGRYLYRGTGSIKFWTTLHWNRSRTTWHILVIEAERSGHWLHFLNYTLARQGGPRNKVPLRERHRKHKINTREWGSILNLWEWRSRTTKNLQECRSLLLHQLRTSLPNNNVC